MQDWNPDELKAKLEAGESVFLKLWKPACGPCKMSKPAVERIEKADESGMHFGQVNVADYPEMHDITGVGVTPAFFVFRDGKMKGKFEGFKGLAKLQEMVDEAVK